jgi:WD40 repeat protein
MSTRGKLRVLTGSTDLTAKLWDVDSLATRASGETPATKELLTLKGHSRALTSVAFSPAGDGVLTASRDGLAILWPALLEPRPAKNANRNVGFVQELSGTLCND